MVEKIKNNLKKVILILSLVAGFIFTYYLAYYFTQEITESTLVYTIEYGLMIASSIVLAFFSATKERINKNMLYLPLALFFGGITINQVYNLFQFGASFQTIFMLALYVSIIIIYGLSIAYTKLKEALLILIITFLCFIVASIFSGSTMAIAELLIIACFVLQIIFNFREEEINE